MHEKRLVRSVEDGIKVVVAIESTERAAKTYEMFRDNARDEMRRASMNDPALSALTGREVFIEMIRRWLGLDRQAAIAKLEETAKVLAFLELTVMVQGENDEQIIIKRSFEQAGKSAWSLYLGLRTKNAEG
jgi:hypothetical protein